MAEFQRGFRNYLNEDRSEHHSVNRLRERGIEKGSGPRSMLMVRNDPC